MDRTGTERRSVDRPGQDRPGQDRPTGDGVGVRPAVQGITQVLAGLEYPAAKWQVLAEADHYGADSASRAQLWTLRPGTYRDLRSVLAELGLVADTRIPASGRGSRSVRLPRR